MRDLEQIRVYLQGFARDRDWEKFHSPKNLSMAISVEVAELVEHFQWLTEAESQSLNTEKKQAVADEIADIQLYLVRLADQLNIDIFDSIALKTQKNEQKYPANKVRGSSKKYNEY
ncbi:nucleotide pyrophosphohydrolase [Teredinibacter haidensis]|uniref:nucleotide pyrophosphohydrolase n=1 Tax=Teredinibacter haidensis TaxID=2731755 RepID=UPI000948B65D|nr:nucleotide pyrophosphohydrolase [Teredinibacter haidensis]